MPDVYELSGHKMRRRMFIDECLEGSMQSKITMKLDLYNPLLNKNNVYLARLRFVSAKVVKLYELLCCTMICVYKLIYILTYNVCLNIEEEMGKNIKNLKL